MKIPVNMLFEYLRMMLRDQWGYIFGTAGVLWTEEKQKKLEQTYSEDDENYGMSVKYGSKWIGHTVTDCSGVMVFIWKQFCLKIPHGSTSMVRQKYIVDCGSIPHPGWAALVDPTPDTDDNKHIGIVSEDGLYVYEAKGTQSGFVKTLLSKSKFNKFGRFKDVDYSESEEPVMSPIDAYYATITGDNVRLRSGPGTNYTKVGTANLFNGEKVEVLADCDNWKFCQVLSDNRQGYVYSKYVSDPITVEIPSSDEPTDIDEFVMVRTEDMKELIKMARKIVEQFGPLLEVGDD